MKRVGADVWASAEAAAIQLKLKHLITQLGETVAGSKSDEAGVKDEQAAITEVKEKIHSSELAASALMGESKDGFRSMWTKFRKPKNHFPSMWTQCGHTVKERLSRIWNSPRVRLTFRASLFVMVGVVAFALYKWVQLRKEARYEELRYERFFEEANRRQEKAWYDR
jgi:hypothetical protein